jgi:replicative DNA helicase
MTKVAIKQPIDFSNLVFGKLPPQALDLEKTVLGAIMLESEAIYEVIDILQNDSFYKQENQVIYNAIIVMNRDKITIDMLTLTNYLTKNGQLELIGGTITLMDYMTSVASTANIRSHALIIEENAIRRRMIQVGHNVINQSFDDSVDTFSLLEEMQFDVLNKVHKVVVGKNVDPEERVLSTMEQVKHNISRKGEIIGIPTGSELLDRITGGYRGGKLIVVAGKPGQGKTAWALHNIKTAVAHNHPTLFFSIEMPTYDVDYRLFASDLGFYYKKIANGNLFQSEIDDLNVVSEKFKKMPLYIDDSTTITTDILRTKIYKYVKEYGVKFVVIDYLNLIRMTSIQTSMRSDQAYGDIVNTIRSIARDMDVPIMLLCQLSKDVDKRGTDKKPNTGDLKETSTIEQSADIIIFPYRPAGHGITLDAFNVDVSKITYLLVRKNKQGDSPLDITMGCDIGMNQYWEVELQGNQYVQTMPPISLTKKKLIKTSTITDSIPF